MIPSDNDNLNHQADNEESTESKRHKQKLKAAMIALSLQLELNEGLRFNVSKGTDAVVSALKVALLSDHPSVKQSLVSVIELLSPSQKLFFQNKGVMLESAEQPTDPDSPQPGKKKIVYRGQVKWV